MLRTFHKYRIVFLSIVGVASIALALSGYVHQFMARPREHNVITIDKTPVAYDDYYAAKKQAEQYYLSKFGANFARILHSPQFNFQQQVVDRVISSTLLQRAAAMLGLVISDQSVTFQIQEELRGSPDPQQQYRALLHQVGMTGPMFEDHLRKELLARQLQQVIFDSSIASERETQAVAVQNKTEYSVVSVTLSPAQFLEKVPAPTDDQIQKYYEENSSDFEVAPRLAYRYVVLDAEKFQSQVEVTPDDIELYYSENQGRFTSPERFRLRVIQLPYGAAKDSKEVTNPLQKQVFQKKANDLSEKLKAGEDFAVIAKSESADTQSAGEGGDVGYLTREEIEQRFGKELATRVTNLTEGAISDVIDAESAFYLAKLEQHKEASLKELSEVKPEIELEIRKREAPAYAATRASELLESWQRSEQSLDQLLESSGLKKLGLQSAATESLLARGTDPKTDAAGNKALSGLTTRLLDFPDQKHQLVDLGELAVLAEITDYKASEVSPLPEAKPKIVELLKNKAAAQLARESAEKLLEELRTGNDATLEALAKQNGYDSHKEEHLTRSSAPSGALSKQDVRTSIFATSEAMKKPTQIFAADGNQTLVQVVAINPPASDTLEKDVAAARQAESEVLGEVVLNGMLKRLRAQANVEIDPSLTVRE